MKTETKRADGSANIAIMHEVWRQAYASATPFEIPCGTTVEANRLRTALYNSVRNVKKFPNDYPTLSDAVLGCELVFHEEDKSVLVLRRKELSPGMVKLRRILEARGVKIGEEVLKGTAETREIAASMDRLLGQLHEPATSANPPDLGQGNSSPSLPGGHNPFFSRG